MRVDAISFGNKTPANHEEMQNKALAQIWKHWQETGDYSPARIDYFEGREPKITYISGEKNTAPAIKKSSNIFSKLVNIFKKSIKK